MSAGVVSLVMPFQSGPVPRVRKAPADLVAIVCDFSALLPSGDTAVYTVSVDPDPDPADSNLVASVADDEGALVTLAVSAGKAGTDYLVRVLMTSDLIYERAFCVHVRDPVG
jgi:hypothetical protein